MNRAWAERTAVVLEIRLEASRGAAPDDGLKGGDGEMNRVRPLNPGIVQLLGKELGPAIAEVRERRKFSREDLAALAGMTPKAVEHREMGRADHPQQRETSEETLS